MYVTDCTTFACNVTAAIFVFYRVSQKKATIQISALFQTTYCIQFQRFNFNGEGGGGLFFQSLLRGEGAIREGGAYLFSGFLVKLYGNFLPAQSDVC